MDVIASFSFGENVVIYHIALIEEDDEDEDDDSEDELDEEDEEEGSLVLEDEPSKNN